MMKERKGRPGSRISVARLVRVFGRLVSLWVLTSSSVARADDEPVEAVRLTNTTVASVNPFVAVDVVQLSYQRRLYSASSPILRRNFFEASASLAMSSFVAPRLRLAIHPLAVVDVGVSYGVTAVYAKTLEERQSPSDPYNVDVVGVEAGETATLQSFAVDMTLQGALGRVLFRSTNAATYTVASLGAGETVYYSLAADLLLPAHGWLLSDETTLAYAITPRLRVGVMGTLFATRYPSSAYAPGASHADVTNSPTVRVGPSFSMTLRDEGEGPFARTDLFAAVQWYAHDRYRTGEAISGAIPFCSVGVRFGGPVWKR